MNRLSHALALLFCATLVSGCIGGGGGGGSSSDSGSGSGGPAPEDVVSLSNSVDLQESGDTYVEVANASSLSVSGSSGRISVEKVGDGLFKLSLGDVDRPMSITIKAVSSGGEVLKQVTVDVINTSAQDVIRKAERIANHTEAVIDLPEDRRYFAHVLDLLYLRGDITSERKQELLTSYDERSESWKKFARLDADHVETTLSQYRSGESGELTLSSATDIFDEQMQTAGDANMTNLDRIPDAASDFVPELANTTVSYDPNTGTYSRFYGDPAFGKGEGDAYTFDDAYKWLREIAKDSGLLMCDATASTSS